MGQTTGPRGRYIYEQDDGTVISFQQDCDLADAVGNDPAASEPFRSLPQNGRFLAPRIAYFQASDDPSVRKTITVGDPEALAATAVAPFNVQIDGRSFDFVGRRGERFSVPTGACSNGNGNGD
jgi:hypothetical protein